MMKEKFSEKLLFAFGRGIAQGKMYRDIILREYPALGSYTGKYLQSQILHACTDFAITRHLPKIHHLRVTEKRNVRNYSFLQIETEHFYMTTSHVRRCTSVPRYAHFRCVRAMSNQPFLFDDLEEQRPKGKPYLILVHGLVEKKQKGEVIYEKLFGGIGMPCADMPTRWNDFMYLTDYIGLEPHIPEEIIDPLDPGFMKFKKNLMGNVDNNDSA